MYRSVLLFLLFIPFFSLHAQEKIVIGIVPTKSEDYQFRSNEETEITNAVTAAFSKTQRFTLVDRMNTNAVDQEKRRQRSEDYIDGQTVEQGRSIGAQFLISISSSGYRNDGQVCKFNLHLTVTDVATGQIANSTLIEVKGGSHGKKIAGAVGGAVVGRMTGIGMGTGAMLGSSGQGNEQKALSKALDDIADEIDYFVASNFPAYFSIVEMEEKDKHGIATRVLISGGSGSGISRGDKLKVIEVSEIEVDGKKMTRKKDVCFIRVAKVEDENFSSCSVITEDNNLAELMEKKRKLKVATITE